MAAGKVTTHSSRLSQGGKRRKGVHAKSRNSSLKTSKNYRKKYKGQGK